ncbi:hypothetical protein [Yinghuangia soli]|uniref:Uncharacterized protein n=1 Tax=Yinghuangia soli TaxID=2908204 RepID=A0AA41Q8N9_9ACTN|nr:hypothetical protein [Yinghuangia soli]MCF2533261.1 hypothetical protein [Yinghuangia soli]
MLSVVAWVFPEISEALTRVVGRTVGLRLLVRRQVGKQYGGDLPGG